MLINICENPRFLSILSFIAGVIDIIKIVVPAILILMVTVDLFQAVIGNEDKMAEAIPTSIRRMIFALLVFLVPTIMGFVLDIGIDLTNSNSGNTFEKCMANISDAYIKEAYKGERVKRTQEMEAFNRKIEAENAQFRLQQEAIQKNKLSTNPATPSDDVSVIDYEGGVSKGIVFDPNNLTKISNVSVSEFEKALASVKGASNMVPYAGDIVAAERKYGVNAFFLAGLQAHESAFYTSKIFKNCNNIGGIKVGSSSAKCSYNTTFRRFSSVKESIDYQASILANNYLSPSGKYYNGPSIKGVQTKYCPEASCSSWNSSVLKISNDFFKGVSK